MFRAITFAALCLAMPGQAQQPTGPGSACTIFSEMVEEQTTLVIDDKLAPDLVREKQAVKERREKAIRADPGAFVPSIREALKILKPEDLQVPTTPEGRVTDGSEQYQKQVASRAVALSVLPLLPADVRDPILREYFDKTSATARPVRATALAEHEVWMRDKEDQQKKLQAALANRRAQWFEGTCIGLINAAAAAKSDALLDPVFALVADNDSRVGQNQQVGRYLEALTQRREEVLRRLNLLLSDDQPTDRLRKLEIGRWIKRMEAGNS